MTTPSGRAIPPRRGNAAAASARTKTDGRTRPSSTSARPPGKGRAAYAGESSVLPRRGLAAHAVPLVADELRQLEDGRGADDRRREEEREPGRVLVREADDQAAAHRRARAREAGHERDRLRGADQEGAAPADLARDPRVVVTRGLRRPAAQQLRA